MKTWLPWMAIVLTLPGLAAAQSGTHVHAAATGATMTPQQSATLANEVNRLQARLSQVEGALDQNHQAKKPMKKKMSGMSTMADDKMMGGMSGQKSPRVRRSHFLLP